MALHSPEPALLGKPNELSSISIVAKATSVQTGSSPICLIVPTQDAAMNAGLSAFLVEAVGAEQKQKEFVRFCGESKAGSVSAIDWIGEIKRVWARGASSTLDLARVVSAAKNRLQQHYGQWSRLWKFEQKMPFSKSTADQLAVIGQRMGGLDSQTSENLPRGWNILYCLARLDLATLKQLIEHGFIDTELTIREAKQLVAQFRGETLKTRSIRALLRERLRRLAEYFAANSADFSAEDKDLAETQLTRMIEQIRAAKTAI